MDGVDRQAPDGRGRRQLAPGHLPPVGREARAARARRRRTVVAASTGPAAVAPVLRRAGDGRGRSPPARPAPPNQRALPSGRDARLVEPGARVEPHEVGPVGLHRPDLRLREARLGRHEVEAGAVGRPGGRAVAPHRAPGRRHAARGPSVRVDDPDRRRGEPGRRGRGDVGEGRRLEGDALARRARTRARAEAGEEARLSPFGRNDPDAAAVLRVERDRACRPGDQAGWTLFLPSRVSGRPGPPERGRTWISSFPFDMTDVASSVAVGRERREELEGAPAAERLRRSGSGQVRAARIAPGTLRQRRSFPRRGSPRRRRGGTIWFRPEWHIVPASNPPAPDLSPVRSVRPQPGRRARGVGDRPGAMAPRYDGGSGGTPPGNRGRNG